MRKKTILLGGLLVLILLIIGCILFKAKGIQEQRESGVLTARPVKKAVASAFKDTLLHKQASPPAEKVGKKIQKILARHTISFKSGTAIIDAQGKTVLDSIYGILKRGSRSKVTISGHTDSSGNEAYNRQLSKRRAEAVMEYLKNKGLNTIEYTIRGMGSSQPIDDNKTKQGRLRNRRVEIILEGE